MTNNDMADMVYFCKDLVDKASQLCQNRTSAEELRVEIKQQLDMLEIKPEYKKDIADTCRKIVRKLLCDGMIWNVNAYFDNKYINDGTIKTVKCIGCRNKELFKESVLDLEWELVYKTGIESKIWKWIQTLEKQGFIFAVERTDDWIDLNSQFDTTPDSNILTFAEFEAVAKLQEERIRAFMEKVYSTEEEIAARRKEHSKQLAKLLKVDSIIE